MRYNCQQLLVAQVLKDPPLLKPSRPSSCTTKSLDEVDQDSAAKRPKVGGFLMLHVCQSEVNTTKSDIKSAAVLLMLSFWQFWFDLIGRTFWATPCQRELKRRQALRAPRELRRPVRSKLWAKASQAASNRNSKERRWQGTPGTVKITFAGTNHHKSTLQCWACMFWAMESWWPFGNLQHRGVVFLCPQGAPRKSVRSREALEPQLENRPFYALPAGECGWIKHLDVGKAWVGHIGMACWNSHVGFPVGFWKSQAAHHAGRRLNALNYSSHNLNFFSSIPLNNSKLEHGGTWKTIEVPQIQSIIQHLFSLGGSAADTCSASLGTWNKMYQNVIYT